MYENTGKDQLIDRILDLPSNSGRDQGELQKIRKKLVAMDFHELQQEYGRMK